MNFSQKSEKQHFDSLSESTVAGALSDKEEKQNLSRSLHTAS